MTTNDPIDLLFGGMAKLGPSDDAETLNVLRRLPRQQFDVIVDAGCGTGPQTLVLARTLQTRVHAADSHEPFLSELRLRAKAARLDQFVETHCMNMQDIPSIFPHIDLLWSEGAAYNIGFAHALTTWAPAIADNGFLVVSELCWLRDHVPDRVRQFFATGYQDMRSLEQNRALATGAGFEVLTTRTLSDDAWVSGYYDVLEPRATALLEHSDPSVRELAAATLEEIRVFNAADGSYGYVFYILRRAP